MANKEDKTNNREELNAISGRLKILENRYNDVRKMIDFVETNMITNQRKTNEEIRESSNEIYNLKRSIEEIQNVILAIKNELSLKSDKEEIEVMKKYTELWDPTRFVTIDQVQKMIDEIKHHRAEEKTEKRGKK